MSIKKKLGMGVATAALGLSLVAGGTFAYFSDTAEAESTFAAGTLELDANPSTIINVDNLKPGDTMNSTFKLENNGSLDISKVLLATEYDNEEFAKHIQVNFLKNNDKAEKPVSSVMLDELKNMDPNVVYQNFIKELLGYEKGGLKAGDNDSLHVQFEFVDNGKDQNDLQGAELELEWTFEAHQTKGERK